MELGIVFPVVVMLTDLFPEIKY